MGRTSMVVMCCKVREIIKLNNLWTNQNDGFGSSSNLTEPVSFVGIRTVCRNAKLEGILHIALKLPPCPGIKLTMINLSMR